MIGAFCNGESPRVAESEIPAESVYHSTYHMPHEMHYLQFPEPARFHLAFGSLHLQHPLLGTNIPNLPFLKLSIIYIKSLLRSYLPRSWPGLALPCLLLVSPAT